MQLQKKTRNFVKLANMAAETKVPEVKPEVTPEVDGTPQAVPRRRKVSRLNCFPLNKCSDNEITKDVRGEKFFGCRCCEIAANGGIVFAQFHV